MKTHAVVSFGKKLLPSEVGWHASGRAGILPAAFRILRNAHGRRERFIHKLTSAGCRVEYAARRVGYPPYPMHAVLHFRLTP